MTDHAVIIAGAGPTGLMLAGELALAGVDVVIVERRSSQDVVGMRARGVHARTIELFDQRGIVERFLAEGQTFSTVAFAWIRLDIRDLPTRHPYGLAIPQNDIERLLAGWIGDLGVRIHRGDEVVNFTQDQHAVHVELRDGRVLTAEYLVGCDGGRSSIRKIADIAFTGWDPTISNILAEVEFNEDPPRGLRHDALGVHSIAAEATGRFRVLVTEPGLERNGDANLGDLSEALEAVYGSDFGVHSPASLSRFTDVTLQASSYRKGRVLLAGDAAHIHYPAGGLGLNLGVQDAVNLGWKLAQVVQGQSPETLLDTYHSEQHPVAARVLRNTMAQVVLLGRLDDRKTALREVFAELLAMDEPRKQFGAMMSGLDIHYGPDALNPLVGRRVPDIDIATAHGKARLYTLLREARPVLLNFDEPRRFDLGPWADRVRMVDSNSATTWDIPVIGPIAPPGAVLVRPDGHAAWVEHATDQSLLDALEQWFGKPASGIDAVSSLEATR